MSQRTEKIIELRNNGLTRRKICEALNISRSMLSTYINQLIKRGLLKKISRKESEKRKLDALGCVSLDIKKAKRLRIFGYSDNEIAEKLGVSAVTVSKHLGPKDNSFITFRRQEILSLRKQGLSYSEIANKLGICQGTVAATIHRMKEQGLISII